MGLMFSRSVCAALFLAASALPQIADSPSAQVAGIPVNYTESQAGAYTLPDPLKLANGKPVRDAKAWVSKRRPEIVRLFEENQYGQAPQRPPKMSFDVFDKGTPAYDGKALRRQITIHFSEVKSGPKLDLLLYLPANAAKRVPVLLNIAFTANSNMVDDPGVKQGEVWSREKKRVPAATGRRFGSLKILPFLEAGIGVATFYYGDVEPDFAGGESFGVRGQFKESWGAIAAWAWGMSRALDYLETDAAVDAKRVAITGISRLGKTVMWAGARDTRFAAVIASCSGEGGAALSRRNYGETIAHLTEASRYPYQFTPKYADYGKRVEEFPVDANLLVALIAPRPLLLQTGNTDKWSDPMGEFLAAVAAGPVYRLFGKQDLGTAQLPAPGTAILNTLGYLMHDGGHGTVPSDWDIYLQFLKKHL
ncbi:MAG: acetylxylan esterase [Bryobacterales bacterium]|nr:acetylxylan esterase [Bryobacterales bacterium]